VIVIPVRAICQAQILQKQLSWADSVSFLENCALLTSPKFELPRVFPIAQINDGSVVERHRLPHGILGQLHAEA
jgi:hypothetical protein